MRHPVPKVVKRCRLSEGYGHRDTLAANRGDPNDPTAILKGEQQFELHQPILFSFFCSRSAVCYELILLSCCFATILMSLPLD
jgi:hypothetical protein